MSYKTADVFEKLKKNNHEKVKNRLFHTPLHTNFYFQPLKTKT